MLEKIVEQLERIANWLILIFLGITSLCTVIFTTVLNYQMLDFPITVASAPPVIALLVLFLLVISRKQVLGLFERIPSRSLARWMFLYGVAISTFWVFVANTSPAWDSADLLNAARHLLGSQDPAAILKWEPGDYIDHFPFQVPLVFFFAFCAGIAQDRADLLLSVFNCLANGITLYLVVRLASTFFNNRKVTCVAALLSISFFGLILYSTFIYGNLYCLPFFLVAFQLLARFFGYSGEEDHPVRHPVLVLTAASVLLGCSVLAKSTMQIAVIAFAIALIFGCLKRKQYAYVLFAAVPIVFTTVVTTLCFSAASALVGRTISNESGVPKTTWIVMGIGGGREWGADLNNDPNIANEINMPGFYDTYVWADTVMGEDFPGYDELNSTYLRKRLGHFADDPAYAARFFFKKYLIEWCEPTFEGYLASNWDRPGAVPEKTCVGRDYTFLGKSFYYGKAHTLTMILMDVGQSAIMIGAFAATALSLKRKIGLPAEINGLAYFALGGALLYLAWELKSQYMFPFYLALIPISALGWIHLAQYVQAKLSGKKDMAAHRK